jgi:hypothetical protein
MVVLPKLKHQLLFRQLQERFSCDLIPSKFSFYFIKFFFVNTVFKAPSAIKVSILSEYFDNPLAAAR